MHFTTQRGSRLGKWFGISAFTVWIFPLQQGTLPSLKLIKLKGKSVLPVWCRCLEAWGQGSTSNYLFALLLHWSRSTSPRLEPHCASSTHTGKTQSLPTACNSSMNKQENQTDGQAQKWHRYINVSSEFSVYGIKNWKENYDFFFPEDVNGELFLSVDRSPEGLKDKAVLQAMP